MSGKNDDVLGKYSKAWQQLSEKEQQQALDAAKAVERVRAEGPTAPQQASAGKTQAPGQQVEESRATLDAVGRESLGRLPVRETPGNAQAGIAPQPPKSLMADYYANLGRYQEVLDKYTTTPAPSQDKERPKDQQPEKEPGS